MCEKKMENYSVLMSVYNKVKPEELNLSIRSMLHQTLAPEQFVIVWDGPVDKSIKAIAAAYDTENPGLFTFVQLKKNMGLAYALNAGINACRNDLVARMDSDDYSLPDRCEAQVKIFCEDSKLKLLGGSTQHFRNTPENLTEAYGRHPVNEKAIKECIRKNSAFSHPTVMFRKKAVIESGYYDEKLRRSQDHDLFSRMIYLGYKCINIDKVLVLFRADEDCMLRNKNPESCKARVVIQKRLYKRGQCSFLDYVYIRFMVFIMQIMPSFLYVKIYAFLKEKK